MMSMYFTYIINLSDVIFLVVFDSIMNNRIIFDSIKSRIKGRVLR